MSHFTLKDVPIQTLYNRTGKRADLVWALLPSRCMTLVSFSKCLFFHLQNGYLFQGTVEIKWDDACKVVSIIMPGTQLKGVSYHYYHPFREVDRACMYEQKNCNYQMLALQHIPTNWVRFLEHVWVPSGQHYNSAFKSREMGKSRAKGCMLDLCVLLII